MARHTIVVGVFAALSACGGSGGGGSDPPVPPSPGAVAVTFPTPLSLTDAAQVVVHGTASAPSGVASVLANGVAATTGDGFATWQATVPLGVGDNVVSVTGTDGDGAPFLPASVTVRRVALCWTQPEDLAVDASDRVYLVDRDLRAVVRRHLVTGAEVVVTSPDVGSGPTLVTPVSIALDPAAGKAYVGRSGGLTAVDLATGARTALSDSSHGAGPVPTLVHGLVADLGSNRLLGMDGGKRLLGFDLASGDRTDLSSSTVGSGAVFDAAQGLALEPGTGTAFAVDFGAPKSVVEVDLATGDRTVVSDAVTGSGPTLNVPADVEIDSVGDRLLVANGFAPAQVLDVDPTTGDRTVMSGPGVGTGPAFVGLGPCVLDLPRDRLLVGDNSRPAVMAVDLADGDRSDVWRPSIGSGIELYPAFALAPSLATGRVYVAVNVEPWFVEVDLLTGVRSGIPTTGAAIQHVESMRFDAAAGRLLAVGPVGPSECLVSVDLATAVCTVVSGGAVGTGPALIDASELAHDPAGQRAYVLDRDADALYEIDLATGDRAIVSDALTGSGPSLEFAETMDVDVAGGRALVMVEGPARLLSVDLSTGDRTVVSGDGTGAGPGLVGGEVGFDAAAGRAIVSSRTGVQAVDLATGDRTTLASDTVGSGPDFSSSASQDAALEPGGKLLWHVDFARSAVLLIHLESGDRVIVAQ